jgi:hypothetical protein
MHSLCPSCDHGPPAASMAAPTCTALVSASASISNGTAQFSRPGSRLQRSKVFALRTACLSRRPFFALITPTANDASSLQPVDICVTLLLKFGYSLFLIPLYIWRIVTAGKASLDPARWPVVRPTALYNVLTSLLLLAVGAFQLWFWASRVTQPSSAQDCQQYGFFFAGIRPKSLGFRILNLVLHSLGTLMCVILLLIFVAKEMGLLQRSQNHLIR